VFECVQVCAEQYGFSRQDQDEYAKRSYARAQQAAKSGKFDAEIISVESQRGNLLFRGKHKPLLQDEQTGKLTPEKITRLKPVFKPDGGTVTAANASPLSDGAAALVLVSGTMLRKLGLKPLCKVRGFADAEQEPVAFTTAPSVAIPKAINAAGISQADVDFYEINEAFSVVSLANNQILGLDSNKVNVYGGAVSMGHPLGCSGARILVTLCSVLAQEGGKIGVAGICNGGGGASALVVERC